MDHIYPLLKSVTVFFLLVLFIQLLRRQGIFNDTHQPVFNRLVTELALPVTIFSTLAISRIYTDQIIGAAVMLVSIALCCLLAYIACRAMKLSGSMTGSLVMLAGFGSTSTLAYPLIRQTFGADSEAMALGLIIGEFGVCIPFFTLGVLMAAWFGSRDAQKSPDIWPVMNHFFVSPIFISFVLGLLVSQVPVASGFFTSSFWTIFFDYFNNGLEILVAVSLGLMLKPVQIRHIVPLFLLIVGLKLFLQPLLVLYGASFLSLSPLATEILVIEAAMPSGAVAAVIADRYGCDGPLASALVIATYLVSLLTIPLVTYFVLV
ncbi:MAG: AEC family transporter [Methanoregulaceae archaeon]|nr:MAG: AEC family transporter [Methanoregulaceae archaeon]